MRSQKLPHKGQHKKPNLPTSGRFIKSINRNQFLGTQQQVRFRHPALDDLYHWLLSMPWWKFLTIVILFYLVLNCLFSLLYLTTGDGIVNARPGSFSDDFFFSIQTLSTVGYGAMYPKSLYAQSIVTVEILVGLLLLTILTGLMFARFSRPTAKVIFSRVAVVCPYNNIPTLMFRAANRRENQILEAQVQVSLLRNEMSPEGHQLRRFHDLKLLRSRTPVFGLSWLIMHPIDESSPFYSVTLETLEESEAELWITLTGLDETISQTIHTRYAYLVSDLLWNSRFVDIFSKYPDGSGYIDLSRFHDIVPL